jgi:AcrR family transcriptional regulator
MSNDATTTRRDKRRQAILDAASALFSEKGYEAATLSEVVARSGGSLTTLYDLFGGKSGLLAAVVAERCGRIGELVDDLALSDASPEDGLRRIARYVLELLTAPDGIELLRVVVAESPRQPELGRLFYEAGPIAGRRTMGRYIAGQAARGALKVDAPEAAAVDFFHMLLGDMQTRLLCCLPALPEGATAEAQIDRAVGAFMKLYAA